MVGAGGKGDWSELFTGAGEGSDVSQMCQDNFLALPKRSLGLKERVPELLLFRFSELIKR